MVKCLLYCSFTTIKTLKASAVIFLFNNNYLVGVIFTSAKEGYASVVVC